MKLKEIHVKRVIALLATGFMLNSYSGNVKAETNVEDISTIYQGAKVFKESGIRYNGNYFYGNGCGPSSMLNGLIYAINYQGSNEVKITQDFLNYLTNNNTKTSVGVRNYSLLDSDKKISKKKFPYLYEFINSYDGTIDYVDRNTMKYSDITSRLDGDNKLIIGSYPFTNNHEGVFKILFSLYNRGLYDSNLIFTNVPAGTKNLSGPFKSGNSGHYITLTFNVKEFCEEGVFYLVDSYQRALPGEKYGTGTNYKYQYPFAEKPNRYKKFLNNFDCERIQPTIVKFKIKDKYVEKLNLLDDVQDKIDYLVKLYDPVYTYGGSGLIVDIDYGKVKTK